MKGWSIGHISAALLLLIILAAAVLTAFTWYQGESAVAAIQVRERRIAREELREALAALDAHLRRTGQDLSAWEETRQQLGFPEYYPVWRDQRVRDTGLLPASFDALALYDKHGVILVPDRSVEGMPEQLPAIDAPRERYSRLAGHDHILFHCPIHADPARNVLLGYLGFRVDFLTELLATRHFRFIDPATLRVDLPDGANIEVAGLVEHIRYELQPSPYQANFRDVFWRALGNLLFFVLAILAGIAWLLHRHVARPLRAISRDIDELSASHNPLAARDVSSEATAVQELAKVRQSFFSFHTHLAELHRRLELSAEAFEYQASHDALTGVLNRRAYDEDMDMIGGHRTSDRHALLLFDCDRFKAINDEHGHDVGDAVIRAIAEALQKALRAEDRLYRLGGDEFVTLLPGADTAVARLIAERCLSQARAIDFRAFGLAEPISLSIGIAVDDGIGIPIRDLHKWADKAMYRAKQSGGGTAVLYWEKAI